MSKLENIHVNAIDPLISPKELKDELSLNDEIESSIVEFRKHIQRILNKEDNRLMVIIGPCSIHDPKAAWEYAELLNSCRKKYNDKLFIVMRVYFEKPRTTIGWKGLINDPGLDNSCNMNEGLTIARKLMVQIAGLGIPMATEMLDTVVPQYISDLVSWSAIGARTTESQPHREMVSGLSMPVGFKNATNGSLDVAYDAINAAKNPHAFIGIDQDGHVSIVRTKGNPNCHIVLRGSVEDTNYQAPAINACVTELTQKGLNASVMVDCNHGNSKKKFAKQTEIALDVVNQKVAGNNAITSLMIESNLSEGNQKFPSPDTLAYGVSITDSCLGWQATEKLLHDLYHAL